MLCALTKWLISRREDTGRPLPAWAEGHLRRCPSCGEFARLVSSWAEQRSGWRALDLIRPPAEEAPRFRAVLARHRVPTAALAMVFAAVLLGALWLAWPRTPALPSLDELIDRQKVSLLREEIATVENPLLQEMDGLEQELSGAINFLVSRLDPGLGQAKEKRL